MSKMSPSHCKRRRLAASDSDSDHMDETPTTSSVSSPLTEPDEPEEHKHKTPEQHMRGIFEQQFDLEILLKHRELGAIEERIAQVQTLMVQLRKLHGDTEAVAGEPRDFVQRYAHYLKERTEAPEPVYEEPVYEEPQRRIRHPTAKLASNGGYIGRANVVQCIYRRPDGVLVRLVCQDCDRSNFGSTQGFINHCRISHARDYGSHDSAAIACGVEIDDQDIKGREALKQLGRELKKPQRSFSMSAVPRPVGIAPVSLPPPPTKFIPPPKITTFDNLEQLLRERQVAQDVDFKVLVKTSMESVPKSHLFEDESDEEEETQQELGDDATPFQRVIAEARKLKLNVDELIAQGKANGNRPSGYKPARRASGFTKNRKKAQPQTPQKPRTESPLGSPSLRPSFGVCNNNDDVQEMKLEPKKPQPRRISISTPSTRSSTRAASCRAQQNEEEEGSHIVGQLSKFLSLDRFF